MTQLYHVAQLPLFVLSLTCKKCHEEQSTDQFSEDSRALSGHLGTCKTCCNTRRRQRHAEAFPERVKLPVRDGYKRCTTCRTEKPYKDFQCHNGTKVGYRGRCKQCQKEINAQRADVLSTRCKSWRKRNPDYGHHYYLEHREELLANSQQWAITHPEQTLQKSIRRKALKNKSQVEPVSNQRILERDGYHCHICNKAVNPQDIEFDHVIPLSRGGPHSESNIKVAHALCNHRKNSRLLEEMTPFQRRGPD